MDPLVDEKAVDQFFDIPKDTEIPSTDTGTGTTEYFSPEPKQPGSDAGTEPPTEPGETGSEKESPTAASAPQGIDYAAENLKLQQQIAELSLYKPLGEMIKRNPNFLQAVEASLQKLPAERTEPQIERPVAPRKPAAYDPQEAIGVPGSESWKYREAAEAYTAEMIAYYEKRDLQREESRQRETEAMRTEMMQREAQDKLTRELMTEHGYTREGVEEFIKVMSSPESRSLANLVTLHNIYREKQGLQKSVAVKAAQKNVPLPVGITGGGGSGAAQKITDSDAFNIGLLSARR